MCCHPRRPVMGGPGKRKAMGRWKKGESIRKVAPLQTALNGRPGADKKRCEDGEDEAAVMGHVFTPDGPKWTARSGT